MTFAIIVSLLVIARLVAPFPWWSFMIPLFVTGAIFSIRQMRISPFWTGFIAGFLVWAAGNYLFDLRNEGIVMMHLGKLLMVPAVVVVALAGILGGLLSGLALYAGHSMFKTAER